MVTAQKSSSKRIAWLDMAKGYGMIFVIIGHLDVGVLGNWIYSFHMPLFFLLSGYVFSEKYDFITFLKKKCKSIIVPYFWLGIPLLVLNGLKHYVIGDYKVNDYIRFVLEYIVQRRKWTVWFLACLFFLNILFYFTKKLLKTNTKLAIVSVIFPIIGLIYYKYVGVILPWNIDVCFMAYPFFFVGYFYKENREIIDKYIDNKKYSIILFIVFAFSNILFCYLTYKVSGHGLEMALSKYGCAPLTYISAFSGIICIIIVSKWTTVRPIQYIGQYSLLYFVWHGKIMIPASEYFFKLFNISLELSNSIAYAILYKSLQFFFVVGTLTVCNIIVTKTKLKFILGK